MLMWSNLRCGIAEALSGAFSVLLNLGSLTLDACLGPGANLFANTTPDKFGRYERASDANTWMR